MLMSYYRESVWLSWWVWILFTGLIAFFLSAFILQLVFEIPVGTRPVLTYVYVIFIVAFGLIFINFRKLSITVDSEKIEASFGMIKKKISWSEVVSCESTRARLSVYGGVGIRLGLDKSIAFISSSGNAVKIIRKNGRPFVFSTHNPEKLSKTINEISNLKPRNK